MHVGDAVLCADGQLLDHELEIVVTRQRDDAQVNLEFENINAPELGGYGVDHVKVAEGLGCKALRVTEPDQLLPAFEEAKKLAAEYRVPVVVDAVLERITNISMSGGDIASVNEFEELAACAGDAPTSVVPSAAAR